MQLDLEIELLADYPEHIPELSKLWFNELGQKWIPNASVERAVETYTNHLNSENLPLTFIVLENKKPIAMVSVRDNDGIRDDLTPWLGSLIVHPDYRCLGVGEKLIELSKQLAKSMSFNKLYLFALDPDLPDWYQRLGWKKIGMDKLYHHPVTVMEIELTN